MGLTEKITEIENEISRTQKNKATEHHLGMLKAKLAKFRSQLLDSSSKSGAKGDGFEVLKAGNARVALIGFPSVGKSTLLSSLTKTASAVASYEFTTLTCIPGVIEYNGAKIQLLDLPGIIEGAASGKGRGKQVIAVARTSDLVLIMLDSTKADEQRPLLEKELEACGIRLNQSPPDVYFKIKKTGGIKLNSTCQLTKMNEKLALHILHEYKIFNAHILLREDITADQFIDVIIGNRVYIPCLYVCNKIDCIYMEDVDRLARIPHHLVISCNMNLNMDYLIFQMWNYLDLVRIFTKKPGEKPDFGDPIILRKDPSIRDICNNVHKTLADNFRYALVWGRSAKHNAQRVGLNHKVADEDVIQIIKN